MGGKRRRQHAGQQMQRAALVSEGTCRIGTVIVAACAVIDRRVLMRLRSVLMALGMDGCADRGNTTRTVERNGTSQLRDQQQADQPGSKTFDRPKPPHVGQGSDARLSIVTRRRRRCAGQVPAAPPICRQVRPPSMGHPDAGTRYAAAIIGQPRAVAAGPHAPTATARDRA
jgi:hypothetical protein